MAIEETEIDQITGRRTTGHIWNGIKELDTPIPRGVLIFLIVTHLFAALWWLLHPAWPLGTTYTKGLIGGDQKQTVERKIVEAAHGRDGKGGQNYPDLTDDDWLWGGEPERIVETMTVGVNSRHSNSRVSQMPAFGADEMLDRKQVTDVGSYVYSLSSKETSDAEVLGDREAGHQVFLASCVSCHGEDAKGKADLGAPNLTDGRWIYDGTLSGIIETVHGGRQGHMPTWDERLTPAEIKILALYVSGLGGKQP